MNNTIRSLCLEHTDLSIEEIEEIESASKRLANMSSLFDADAFIDCLMSDGSGDSIVVAEANPMGAVSSYTGSVVGMVATKEKEPAVHRTLTLGVTTRFMKAETQENVNVIQTVDPIFSSNRVIGVYIIEQRMESVNISPSSTTSASVDDNTIDMDYAYDDRTDTLSLVDSIEEGLMFVDNDGRVSMCNKAMLDIYRRLGFINDIKGLYYDEICLIKEDEIDEKEKIYIREVKVGNYYFRVKRVNAEKAGNKFLVTLADITAKKTQEKALVLKSVAVKEMHHRIKNNLQTIASLLRLQRNRIESQEGKAALDDSVNRILAISATHELMLDSEIDSVQLNDIINSIKENIEKYSKREDFLLEIECHGGDFDIGTIKAVSVALILNELIQNSIKYAFRGRNNGKITIIAIRKGEQTELTLRDNGCGFDVKSKIKDGTMGLSIVKLMTEEKLKGHMVMKSDSEGTKFKIFF